MSEARQEPSARSGEQVLKSDHRGIWTGILLLAALSVVLLQPDRPRPTVHRPLPTGHRPPPTDRQSPARGLDTGMDAIRLAAAGLPAESRGGWMRVRGVDLAKIPETRNALRQTRAMGLRTCVLLRLSVSDWKRKYLPEDLHEPYEHGRKLGAAFGDLVDAWEVDNEPDIGFVPELAERYTAFLKAMYLGLKQGIADGSAPSGKRNAANDPSSVLRPLSSGAPPSTAHRSLATSEPLVLMGSLGLPPGPWLERFAANDGFAYTDGFNYHYYGYAEDFTGVYRQHEAAVAELSGGKTRLGVKRYESAGPGTDNKEPAQDAPLSDRRYELGGSSPPTQELLTPNFTPPNFREKNLPIFLTEIGYGMLGQEPAKTKDGRLRQWRWFKSVGEQTDVLRIEAPMGFYLPPYLEYGLYEYGLTVPVVQRTDDGRRWTVGGGQAQAPNTKWTAGGVEYEASDFTEALITSNSHPVTAATGRSPNNTQPITHNRAKGGPPADWRSLIGTKIDGKELTPAGAWWIGAPRDGLLHASERNGQSAKSEGLYAPYASRTANRPPSTAHRWSVSTPPTSPVVLDFLSDEGLSAIKRYNGHFVTEKEPVIPRTPDPGPQTPAPKPLLPREQTDEFNFLIRTANGNLFQVYPTRQLTSTWQQYLEPHDNFTALFYGRAALPWRFKDNKPASFVVVMYPKQLPAVFDFRHPQLLRLGEPGARSAARDGDRTSVGRHQTSDVSHPPYRHGLGRIILYNFSDQPVTGRLLLPDCMTLAMENDEPASTGSSSSPDATRPDESRRSRGEGGPNISPPSSVLRLPRRSQAKAGPPSTDSLTLAPQERRVVEVAVTVPAMRYERFPAEIEFVFDEPLSGAHSAQLSVKSYELDGSNLNNQQPITNNHGGAAPNNQPRAKLYAARFRTDFLPGIAGTKATVVASLLPTGNRQPSTVNRALVASRQRATEEALMTLQIVAPPGSSRVGPPSTAHRPPLAAFVQSGAQVEQTADGFTVTVTSLPPDKVQRIEVEIPWPDGLDFPADAFLSLEFRLK